MSRPRRLAAVAALAAALTAPRAAAEPADDAPPPDEAGGVLIPRDTSQYAVLWVPRTLLFVPRWALEVPFAVPRAAIYAYKRYDLRDRFVRLFFNDDETIGLYPTAFIETGYGLNVGARFVYRDLLGPGTRLRARAGYGGQFEQEGAASFTSGELLGRRVELGLDGDYAVHPRSRFFGIGNVDGVASRYRSDDVDVELGALIHASSSVHLRLLTAYHWTRFDPDADLRGDLDIRDAYDTRELAGYDTDLSNVRAEVGASYDTRRVTREHLARPSPSTGWLLSAFGQVQEGIGDDPSHFVRWGGDVQRYFDLWLGDRVLILRAYVEGVTGDRDAIPFVDLPTLGGEYLLRGYSRDRFRDRFAGAATAEYDYPVQKHVTAFLFVDAGKVWSDRDDFESGDWRVGYGGGIQLHSFRSFLGRVFVASSIDGGVHFNLSLDPVFGENSRTERKR